MTVQGIFLSPYCEDGEWRLDPVARCFSTHLKSITIKEFGGTKGELHVVTFLLESALILERLVISCSLHKFSGGVGRQKEVHDQLMLSRRSRTCAIEFSRAFLEIPTTVWSFLSVCSSIIQNM